MTGVPDWPGVVIDHLRRRHGEILAVDRLGGMSLARVYRARFAASSVIVKITPRSTEPMFYASLASELRAARVPVPAVELNLAAGGVHWLVLEDLPYPLGGAATGAAEPERIAVLARLHAATRGRTFTVSESPAGGWPDTAAALSLFPAATALADVLADYQRRATALGEPWCWISGDPSLPNWGRRHDGTLALFDWELFRPGVPATDLAISVPGLPARDAFARTARTYLDCWGEPPLPWPLDELVSDMVVAKVSTVVAMLAAQAGGSARVPGELLERLIRETPPWLDALRAGERNAGGRE